MQHEPDCTSCRGESSPGPSRRELLQRTAAGFGMLAMNSVSSGAH
jgi:hypothetical protein